MALDDIEDHDPLKGGAPGEDKEYDSWRERGQRLVRRTLKERKGLPRVRRVATQKPTGDGDDTGPPYDVRDVGGDDFEIGASHSPAYEAIRVTASGDVTIETASGDTSVIAADADGTFEEVTVRQVVSATVDPSEIILYR